MNVLNDNKDINNDDDNDKDITFFTVQKSIDSIFNNLHKEFNTPFFYDDDHKQSRNNNNNNNNTTNGSNVDANDIDDFEGFKNYNRVDEESYYNRIRNFCMIQ